MIPTKAYILRHDVPISHEYASHTANTCDAVGLDWEYFEGFHNIHTYEAWNSMNITPEIKTKSTLAIDSPKNKAGLCTASHVNLWKKIARDDECVIVLEHDAVMLHKPEIDIPENTLVALGYKISDPEKYNHESAGAPKEIKYIQRHAGTHAYALTKNMAKFLIDEIKQNGGGLGCVDMHYFNSKKKTKAKLAIMDPIAAVGWLRESTIWGRSAVSNVKDLLTSYRNNYHESR